MPTELDFPPLPPGMLEGGKHRGREPSVTGCSCSTLAPGMLPSQDGRMKMRSHLSTPGHHSSKPADREVNYFEWWKKAQAELDAQASTLTELLEIIEKLRAENKALQESLYNS